MQSATGSFPLERGLPPGPRPKRLIDMTGSEAVVHMLKDARRRLCPKMERWDQASLYRKPAENSPLYALGGGGIVRV